METGYDVIVKQTHYKARFSDAFIAVYVMCPSDGRWKENIRKRKLEDQSQCIMEERDEIEFSNVSEGFDAIYQVTGGEVELRMDPLRPELPDQARAELTEDAAGG